MSTILSLATLAFLACSGAEPSNPDPVALAAEPLAASPPPASPPPAVGPDLAIAATAEAHSEPMEPRPGTVIAEVQPLVGAYDDDEDVDSYTFIVVRPGESLYFLASLTPMTSEELAALNDMQVTDPLVAGASLTVPRNPFGMDEFEQGRREAADARLDRYLGGRGGEIGRTTRQVQTGDTAWSIAHGDADVPTWVLAAYNPDVDLERLRVGDLLVLPVLGDTVVGDTVVEPPETADVGLSAPAGAAPESLAEVSTRVD